MLPLNSPRLTLRILKTVARGLELPTNTIDGKLESQEIEPRNVQVGLYSMEGDGEVRRVVLYSAQGSFLDEPVEPASLHPEIPPKQVSEDESSDSECSQEGD